jgi:hypothetical protein
MASDDVVPTIPTPDLWRVYDSEDRDALGILHSPAVFTTQMVATFVRSQRHDAQGD